MKEKLRVHLETARRVTIRLSDYLVFEIRYLWDRIDIEPFEIMSLAVAFVWGFCLIAPGDYFKTSPRLAELDLRVGETPMLCALVLLFVWQTAALLTRNPRFGSMERAQAERLRGFQRTMRVLGMLQGVFVWCVWCGLLCASAPFWGSVPLSPGGGFHALLAGGCGWGMLRLILQDDIDRFARVARMEELRNNLQIARRELNDRATLSSKERPAFSSNERAQT